MFFSGVSKLHEALRKVPAYESDPVEFFGYFKVTASEWKPGSCTELNRKK